MQYFNDINIGRLIRLKRNGMQRRLREDSLDERARKFLDSSPPDDWWSSIAFDIEMDDDMYAAQRHDDTVAGERQLIWILALLFENERSPGVDYRSLRRAITGDSRNIAVLHAHGQMDNGWAYSDSEQLVQPVQSWVQERSKTHGALLISTCNPGKTELEFAGTPLFYAKGNVGETSEYEVCMITGDN